MKVDKLSLLVPQLPNASALLARLQQIDAQHWYSNFGPLVTELETSIANLLQVHSVVACANGTQAIELAIKSLDLAAGAKILVPAFTFPATLLAIINSGYCPVLADIDPQQWCLTPEIATEAITQVKVSAVLPVATYGCALDAEAWSKFSQANQLPIIVDAAGAFGNQSIAAGLTLCFSLHATKSFSSGEGGLIVTSDPAQTERLKVLSNFGINSAGKIESFPYGTNAKMSEFHAAVGLESLKLWPSQNQNRLQKLECYLQAIASRRLAVQTQQGINGQCVSMFSVKFSNSTERANAELFLTRHQVETRRWYCPLSTSHNGFSHLQQAMPLQHATKLAECVLGLPFHLALSEKDIARVLDLIGQSLNQSSVE